MLLFQKRDIEGFTRLKLHLEEETKRQLPSCWQPGEGICRANLLGVADTVWLNVNHKSCLG